MSQYKYMFTLDNSELVFTDDALDAIAELAIKKRTGKLGMFHSTFIDEFRLKTGTQDSWNKESEKIITLQYFQVLEDWEAF